MRKNGSMELYKQGKAEELGEKHVPVSLSTTAPTWTDMVANPIEPDEKPQTNGMSYGTEFHSLTLTTS
jgi:hypothetical protein